jgi:hypothetical protein
MSRTIKFGDLEVAFDKLLTHEDPIVGPPIVINTDDDVRRMEEIAVHLEDYRIPVIRIPAITNLSNLPACNLTRHQVNKNLSHGAANRFAHLFDDVKRPLSLILEDDCRFLGNPRDAVAWVIENTSRNWSVVSLGCHSVSRPPLETTSRHFDPARDWQPDGSHSYLISAAHAMRLTGLISSCVETVNETLLREIRSGRGHLVRPSFTVQEEYVSYATGDRRSTRSNADV